MARRGQPVEDRHLKARSLKLRQCRVTNDGALFLQSPQPAPLKGARYAAADDSALPSPDTCLSPFARDQADLLFQRVIKRILAGEHFDASGFVANLACEFYSRSPWHTLFARQLLEQKAPAALPASEQPALRIYHDPTSPPSAFGNFDGEHMVIFDFRELRALVLGTAHAGEIRHTLYTLANYLLPRQAMLGVHGALALGPPNRGATLLLGRADSGLRAEFLQGRSLVAESAALWSEAGLSRLEASLYTELAAEAKTDASYLLEAAPTPARAAEILRGATVLANPPVAAPVRAGRVVMLCEDPTGGLPLLSRLDPEQARFHYLAGYGSRAPAPGAAGGGFNPCFAYLCIPLPPPEYASLFTACLEREQPELWLINTGTVAGENVPRALELQLLDGIHEGRFDGASFEREPAFGLAAATALPGVEPRWLRRPDPAAAAALAEQFRAYFAERDWPLTGGPAK